MATNGGAGLSRLGAWAARRAEPRLWVSLAGAGCVVAVTGLLLVAADAQAGDDGDGSTTPGIILFLLVVAAGYLLMYRFREAPGASAGVTAVVLGVPPLAYFVTYDATDLPPFSIEAVLGLSALVWLISYAVGPGRARPLFLGAGLVFAWLFALQVIEDPLATALDGAPIIGDGPFGNDPFGNDPFSDDPFADDPLSDDPFSDDPFGDDPFGDSTTDDPFADDAFAVSGQGSGPSWTTLGITSIVFGAGYLIASRLLDRRGFAGTATPFVAAGHVILPLGILMLADELEAIGAGFVFIVTGGLLALLGAVDGRRATTVIGAVDVILGVYMVVGDAMDGSSATGFGTALFVLGGAVVAGAHALHLVTGEPPQTTPGPSSFGGRPPGTGPMPGDGAGPASPSFTPPYPPRQPGAAPPIGTGPPVVAPPSPPPPPRPGGTPF